MSNVILGHQTLTIGTAAVSLTIPEETKHALITVRTAAVRFRGDGTSPTATDGFPLETGDTMRLTAPDLNDPTSERVPRFIRRDNKNAELSAIYTS